MAPKRIGCMPVYRGSQLLTMSCLCACWQCNARRTNLISLLGAIFEEIEHTFRLEEWKAQDLSAEDQALLQAAYEACQSAYSPYSKFNVGSAVRLEDGTLIKGSNQENAAYPSGLCAERVAFFTAGAQHAGTRIIAAAVVTDSSMPVEDFRPAAAAVKSCRIGGKAG